MSKIVIFAFKGDPMCFIHVLLNGLDLNKKGLGGKIVIEGEAVKLIPEMAKKGHFLNGLYIEAKEAGLIEGVCYACSKKLGALDAAEEQGLKILNSMSGHVSMADFIKDGYDIVTM